MVAGHLTSEDWNNMLEGGMELPNPGQADPQPKRSSHEDMTYEFSDLHLRRKHSLEA